MYVVCLSIFLSECPRHPHPISFYGLYSLVPSCLSFLFLSLKCMHPLLFFIGPRESARKRSKTNVHSRNMKGETPLQRAAIAGDADAVAQLIAEGADVNTRDYTGW